jgi:hypothetical protein
MELPTYASVLRGLLSQACMYPAKLNNMKAWYLLITLFLFRCANSQNKNDLKSIDSLRKYSYLIVGLQKEKGTQDIKQLGTGFFFNIQNEGMYFLTAKHIVSDINTFNKKPTGVNYDIIGIRYFNKKNDSFEILPVNLKNIKYHIANKYFYETPDFIYFKIDPSSLIDAGINEVSYFFYNYQIEPFPPTQIISWGYAYTQESSLNHSLQTVPIIFYEGKIADNTHIDPYYPYPDSLNLITQPESIQGMSGSPAFYKYTSLENGKTKEWIRFGGVMFGRDTIYKSAYIIKPETVFNQFKHATIYDIP